MFCTQCGAQVDESAGFCSNCGAKMAASRPAAPPPMTGAAPMPSAPPTAASVRYAGFWIRWVANFVDSLLLSAPMMILVVLGSIWGIFSPTSEATAADLAFIFLFLAFSIALTWLYFAYLESSPDQATFGKRLLGLKVINYEGGRIGFGRATGRFWAKVLSGIPFNIGYIMAAFTEKKQALHDMLAKTFVVRR